MAETAEVRFPNLGKYLELIFYRLKVHVMLFLRKQLLRNSVTKTLSVGGFTEHKSLRDGT